MTTKREELFDGAIRLATVPFILMAPVGAPSGGSTALILVALFLALCAVVSGTGRIAGALLGDEGLVCDIGRLGALVRLRNDRASGLRARVTKPSRALVARGQVARVRGVRFLKRV